MKYSLKDKTNWSKEQRICKFCKTEFQAIAYEKKTYCSPKCSKKVPWNKGKKTPYCAGENHYKWKGGRSKGYKLGYYSLEYRNWRKEVFDRDNYSCVDCGEAGYITAHHIKSFAYYPELRYELSNGKTLCEKCHEKTDNYKGRAKRLVLSKKVNNITQI